MRGGIKFTAYPGLTPLGCILSPLRGWAGNSLIPHERKVILRAQGVKSILHLLVNFRLFDSAFQDDRGVRRNEMRHLLKGEPLIRG